MKKILILVGTRPNFIKVTQFKRVAQNHPGLEVKIVHTGQHYDKNLSNIFFDQFELRPDFFLEVGKGTPNTQMGNIMLCLEKLINEEYSPDLIIVPGDVNSTLAGAITANKMNIKLAHLESGLRSDDNSMPEEINRILTDKIADYLFVTEQSGLDNLLKETTKGEVFFVGNTMIDTLCSYEKHIEGSDVLSNLRIQNNDYALMTIHRPSNVDDKKNLLQLIEIIQSFKNKYNIVLPLHPRTKKVLEKFELKSCLEELSFVKLLGPLGYFEFQKLIKHAKFILTDSGGIQEESTYRQVPCLTLRNNTERPSTITEGTNTLVPLDTGIINQYVEQIEEGTYKKGTIPENWDGKSTERVMDIIANHQA